MTTNQAFSCAGNFFINNNLFFDLGCKLHKERKSPQEVDEDNVITFQHELEKEPEDEDKSQGIECEEGPNIENKVIIIFQSN